MPNVNSTFSTALESDLYEPEERCETLQNPRTTPSYEPAEGYKKLQDLTATLSCEPAEGHKMSLDFGATPSYESAEGSKTSNPEPSDGYLTSLTSSYEPIDRQDDDQTTLLQEYERLFSERPRGLDKKAAWPLSLEEEHGKACRNKHHRVETNFSYDTWTETRYPIFRAFIGLKHITDRLARTDLSDAPDFFIGQYNNHYLGLVLHGSALDPPTVGFQTFSSLGAQYAHLNMFAGLRLQELSKDDLCVLTLGNVYATTKEPPFRGTSAEKNSGSTSLDEDQGWVDTRFVLAMDTASTDMPKYYLLYKYEDFDLEYLDNGGERRFEEPEKEEPPQFCNGPDAFTVAIFAMYRRPVERMLVIAGKSTKIRLDVVSIKKPSLAVAGYRDADHPYIPVFPPRDI